MWKDVIFKKALRTLHRCLQRSILHVTWDHLTHSSPLRSLRWLLPVSKPGALLCGVRGAKRNLTFGKYVNWRSIRQKPRPPFELPRRPLHENGHDPVPVNRKGWSQRRGACDVITGRPGGGGALQHPQPLTARLPCALLGPAPRL